LLAPKGNRRQRHHHRRFLYQISAEPCGRNKGTLSIDIGVCISVIRQVWQRGGKSDLTFAEAVLHPLELVNAIDALRVFGRVDEAGEGGLELLAARSLSHAAEARAVPVDLARYRIVGSFLRFLLGDFLRLGRHRGRRGFGSARCVQAWSPIGQASNRAAYDVRSKASRRFSSLCVNWETATLARTIPPKIAEAVTKADRGGGGAARVEA
jgi:hypothetical protein